MQQKNVLTNNIKLFNLPKCDPVSDTAPSASEELSRTQTYQYLTTTLHYLFFWSADIYWLSGTMKLSLLKSQACDAVGWSF